MESLRQVLTQAREKPNHRLETEGQSLSDAMRAARKDGGR